MAAKTLNEKMRALPQVEEVLTSGEMTAAAAGLPRALAVEAARDAVAATRKAILAGEVDEVDVNAIFRDAASRLLLAARPSLRRVINATGVVIHTNIGRSPLAPSAIDAVAEVSRGYSTLEYDTDAMARGSRHSHVEALICALTGAEAAMAVNNNAAAVMMVLNEFARGREAVVSRGELVEIGGSFRIPDIMDLSNARMREVGTTNKTHLRDYRRVVNDATSMLLKVHPSNYRVVGFSQTVSIGELRALADDVNAKRAKKAGVDVADTEAYDELLVYEDLGSGAFLELPIFAAHGETTVTSSLKQGMDLVSFSGDKLLGGPQAGIIVGAKRRIDRLKKNPLARAMRLDKMTLAALEATLRLYLDPKKALVEIPTLRMLSESAEAVQARAGTLVKAVTETGAAGVEVACVEEISRVGGGSLPLCELPTTCVTCGFADAAKTPESFEHYLVQENPVPIICRIKEGHVMFDCRTLADGEVAEVAAAVAAFAGGAGVGASSCAGADAVSGTPANAPKEA